VNPKSIEITIPVLNEQETLKKNILKLYFFLKKYNWNINNWIIIIADNGSNDNTQKIGETLSKEFKEINYLRLAEKGVGLALKKSWSESKSNIVGYMDLDLATDLNALKEATDAIINNYDIVYGTRLNKKSTVNGRSLKREITSRVFNKILKYYLGIKFSDGMCGFKFLKKDTFIKLNENGASSNSWFFSTELLVISENLNLKIYELPINWTDNSDSKVKIIPLAVEYLKKMRKLKHDKN
jgi:glycosyltransferase involved in cell wall biosynthesis